MIRGLISRSNAYFEMQWLIAQVVLLSVALFPALTLVLVGTCIAGSMLILAPIDDAFFMHPDVRPAYEVQIISLSIALCYAPLSVPIGINSVALMIGLLACPIAMSQMFKQKFRMPHSPLFRVVRPQNVPG